MLTSKIKTVIDRFRSGGLLSDTGVPTDGELLGSFIDHRDEVALAVLIRRHGPMVWGVCRRMLSHHDAEDAFQATFLVLVRKGVSVAPKELVGNWLYGVARHTALQVRRTSVRRQAREIQVMQMPEPETAEPDEWPDLLPVLDQELSRLPDKYRAVIVLCDLEGRTRKEVARHLGVPDGTVAGRLARARAMLAKRLSGRGVTLSAGALAALTQHTASAGMPNSLLSSTIQATTLVAAGQTAATGAVSVQVAALTDRVLKIMLISKLKSTVAVMVAIVLAIGAAALTLSATVSRGQQPPAAEKLVHTPAKQDEAKVKVEEPFTAWGKELGGLQAGLGYHRGQRQTYRHGETVRLLVRVRNVGKENIQFQYLRHFFIENPPAVTDDQGKRVPLKDGSPKGIYLPVDVRLAPGKEVELYELNLELSNNKGIGVPKDSTLYGPGKFTIQYERVLGSSSLSSVAIKYDPVLEKLATGKLELDVQAEPREGAREATAQHRFTEHLTKVEPWPKVPGCAFLDNDRILVQAATSVLEIRDAKTGKLLKSVGLEKQSVGEFRLSPDRKSVAAVTIVDTTGTFVIPSPDVTVWDTTTWTVRGTLSGHHLFDLAADGRTVLVRDGFGLAADSGRVAVWDVVANKKLKVSPFEFRRFDAAAFSPDGSLVAVSGLNEIAYWRWRDGDKYDRLQVGRTVGALVFTPDGKLVAEGPAPRMTVEVRDIATLKVVQTLADPGQPQISFQVSGMAFADSGKTLALGNGIGLIETIPVPHRIHFWDVTTGKLIQKIELKGGMPYSLDVSPDGKTLAAVTADAGVSLRVFDLDQGNGVPKK